jgi:hypothetical protein
LRGKAITVKLYRWDQMIDSDAKTVIEQLERRNKEIEIIERVASQISKTLNLDAIAKTMLVSMEKYFNFKHSMILFTR